MKITGQSHVIHHCSYDRQKSVFVLLMKMTGKAVQSKSFVHEKAQASPTCIQ